MSKRVKLHADQWIVGTQTQSYAGPIAADFFVPDSENSELFDEYLRAEHAVIEMVQKQARILNAHEIVGYVLTLDPFAERTGRSGLSACITGTAIRLHPDHQAT
jgi:hypothetical protein